MCLIEAGNSTNCSFQVQNSTVISTQTIEVFNCSDCVFLFDEVDVRKLNCYNVKRCTFQFTNEPTLLENLEMEWSQTHRKRDR